MAGLTEAAWLLRNDGNAVVRLLTSVTSGVFEVLQLPPVAGTWMATFASRYRDARPDLADMALMFLAEQRGLDTIFTFDRRDFAIYRTTEGRVLHRCHKPERHHRSRGPRRRNSPSERSDPVPRVLDSLFSTRLTRRPTTPWPAARSRASPS